jgi:hypothetical protein
MMKVKRIKQVDENWFQYIALEDGTVILPTDQPSHGIESLRDKMPCFIHKGQSFQLPNRHLPLNNLEIIDS